MAHAPPPSDGPRVAPHPRRSQMPTDYTLSTLEQDGRTVACGVAAPAARRRRDLRNLHLSGGPTLTHVGDRASG